MSLLGSIGFSKTNLENRFLCSYNNNNNLVHRPRCTTQALKISFKSKITCRHYNISFKSISRACRSYSLSLAIICFVLTTTTTTATSMADVVIRESEETLSNIPQTLSAKDCKKANKIQRPKSKKAESCISPCVTTCIRAGEGSPGEGPLNVRRPIVVFKQGFRSRQYCLVECSDICNLLGDTNDEP